MIYLFSGTIYNVVEHCFYNSVDKKFYGRAGYYYYVMDENNDTKSVNIFEYHINEVRYVNCHLYERYIMCSKYLEKMIYEKL
jgi:hypothetical protein